MLNNMGAGFVLRAYDAATPVVKKVGAAFGWLRKNVKKLDLGGAMSRSLGTSAMGYAALNVGTQMLELMKTAADAGGAFEQRMIGVQNIAGATGEELVAMKEMAIDAALSTAFTPIKVAEAYEVLSSMGLRAKEQMDALIPSLQLATGSMGNLGIAGAAQSVVGSVKAMNFSLKESARVTDQLLKIEQLTNFSTKDFELVLGRTASAAKMYGQSWEDALISIGLIRNLNIDAEVASTALREAWRRMASDEGAQQAIQERGVDIFDRQTNKMRDALSIMIDLTEKTATLNDKERMRMITTAFGVRGIAAYNAVQNASFTVMKNGEPVILSGMNAINAMRYELSQNGDALTKNQEAALKMALGVENLSDVLRTSKGVAKAYQSALLDTYAGQKQLLESGYQALLTVIGEDFAKAMKPWTIMLHEVIVGVAQFIRSLSPEAKQMIFKFVVALGAIIALSGGLMLISGILSMLGGSVIGFVFSIGKILLIGIPVMMLLSGLGVGFKALAGAFGIGGKSGLSFEKILNNVRLALSGMMSLVTGEGFSDSLKKEFEKAENQGVVKFLDKFQSWLERLRSFWDGLKVGFEKGISALAQSSAFKRLQDKLKGIIQIFTGPDAKNTPELLDQWKSKGESAGFSLTRLGETAAGMLEKLIEFGSMFASFVASLSGEDIRAGIQGFIDGFNTIASVVFYVKTTIQGVYLAIKLIISAIIELFGGIVNAFRNFSGERKDISSGWFDPKNWEWTTGTVEQMNKMGQGVTQRALEQAISDKEFAEKDRRRTELRGLETRRQGLEEYIGMGAEEFHAQNKGTQYEKNLAFGEMGAAKQQEYINELRAVRTAIEKMTNKSWDVNISGQKAGDILLKEPALTGEDSLDDTALAPAF